MSVMETAATVQDQVLEAIKAGQNAVLSAVNTLAGSAAPMTSVLSAVPFVDRLPKPVDVVDATFGFAEKLLASQKEFTSKLVDACDLDKTASKPVSKVVAPKVS